MKNYIIIFREPDGRRSDGQRDSHTEAEIAAHRENWSKWFAEWGAKGKLAGGSGLTLNGRIIKDGQTNEGIHYAGTEIVGGFLLLKAEDLDEATAIAASCPIYEFDGYAEVREMQQ
ncbi:YciI family protein [Dyadobacter fermentans]|uniref:YciI family protein n=1 Tax=Dyadobacter fermentans TaxID=94254 RepID=UPI001CC0C45D|nr:YciI family protein [Dyadobacter fermentans]MBZ1362375.1 YciI family protein [Dyadobacter fermentans]